MAGAQEGRELQRWVRAKAGLEAALGARALRSPGRVLCKRGCHDSCFEKIFHSSDTHTEPYRSIQLLAESGFSPSCLLAGALAEGGEGAQVAWRPTSADRRLWTWFLLS